MPTKKLKAYLRDNPLPEDQVRLIQGAQRDLERLRAAGIVSEGYTLAEPYGSKGTPAPSRRRPLHAILKVSEGA
jgi:hypothetical protein